MERRRYKRTRVRKVGIPGREKDQGERTWKKGIKSVTRCLQMALRYVMR